MTHRFVGLTLLAAVAVADAAPNEIELDTIKHIEAPALAIDRADCDATPGTTVVERELTVGRVVFQSRQECPTEDSHATFTILTGQTTYAVTTDLVRYVDKHATAPTHIRLLSTTLTRGTLASGHVVVIQQLDLEREVICVIPGCGRASKKRIQDLAFCLLPVDGNSPACATTRFGCPTGGCVPATVTRGELVVKTDVGMKKIAIRAKD